MSLHPSAPDAGCAAVRADHEFDLWLKRELCRLHGDVLHELVPERLLRVLENSAMPQD